MAELDLLWEYQKADMELSQFEAELRANPRRKQLLRLKKFLADQQELLRKMEEEIERMNGRMAALRAQEAECAETIRGLEGGIEQLSDVSEVRARLQEGRTCAELMARAERELTRMRKETGDMTEKQREIAAKANKAKAEYAQIKVEYDAELEASSGELEALKAACRERSRGIAPELIQRYDSIKLHASPPMATLNGERCGGCNMSLPAVVMQGLRAPGRIVECENCGRILYIPG